MFAGAVKVCHHLFLVWFHCPARTLNKHIWNYLLVCEWEIVGYLLRVWWWSTTGDEDENVPKPGSTRVWPSSHQWLCWNCYFCPNGVKHRVMFAVPSNERRALLDVAHDMQLLPRNLSTKHSLKQNINTKKNRQQKLAALLG